MEPDEPDVPEGDDPLPFRDPPEPHERTWLHPSEVGKLLAGRAATPEIKAARAERSARLRPVAVPLIASMVGGALMLGGIAITGNLHRTIYRNLTTRIYGTNPTDDRGDPDGASAIVARAAPGVFGVRVTSPGGPRSGSALGYRSDGRLLTSQRIVGDASTINIVFADGSVRIAHLVGGDPDTDVAVVTVDGEAPAVATLAKDLGVERGQWAVAVGAANGPGSGVDVSVGFVSALDQSATIGTRSYYNLISTNAIGWPTQSGGALVNRNGVVIGMTMVRDNGMPAMAVPIDIARRVANEIIDHGRASHAWLGLTVTELDAATAGEYGAHGGAIVTEVAANGPAAKAGMQVQDVVTTLNGDRVANQASFATQLLRHQPGDSVSLTVVRAGKPRTMHATLAERPGA